MAVTAKFQADFSGFIEAIDKADLALVDMSKGASKVEASLNRMVDTFSGRKLIQEASLMTIAVEKAGGVAALTAREIETVGAKANEAAEKMKKLGYDVPAGLQRLADATKTSNTHLDSMKSLVSDVAAGLAAMFTVQAGVHFVEKIVNDASAMQDLSNQTHINVEEIQLLAGAMSEFGVDADTLAKGLFGLSRRIAKGDDSVEMALRDMGMSLSDVQGLNGEELFLKIEHGLSTLQGGLRDTTASELFGSKLGMAMAGASEGIDQALATWRQFNHVASAESVEALDKFGEAVTRANRNVLAMTTTMAGPLAEGFNVLFEAADKGVSKWDLAMSFLPKGLGLVGVGVSDLADKIAVANLTLNQHDIALAKVTDGHSAAGASIHKTKEEIRLENEEVKKLTDQWDATEKILQDLHAQTFAQTMKFIRDERTERQKAMQERNKEIISGLTEIQKVESDNADFVQKQTLSTTDYQILKIREWEQATIAAFKGTEQQLTAFTEAVRLRAQQQVDALMPVANIVTLIGGGSTSLLRPDTQSRIQAGPAGGSAFSLPAFSLPTFSLGARAGGGPVSAGGSYLVGERGPELFRPSSSGFISPNGGAVVVNVGPFNFPIMNDPRARAELAAVIDEAIWKRMRSTGLRVPSGA